MGAKYIYVNKISSFLIQQSQIRLHIENVRRQKLERFIQILYKNWLVVAVFCYWGYSNQNELSIEMKFIHKHSCSWPNFVDIFIFRVSCTMDFGILYTISIWVHLIRWIWLHKNITGQWSSTFNDMWGQRKSWFQAQKAHTGHIRKLGIQIYNMISVN